jgi:putative endonuclease
MAGLVPAIHVFAEDANSTSLASMRGGWVYIMTNRPDGTLYTGVTSDIVPCVRASRGPDRRLHAPLRPQAPGVD